MDAGDRPRACGSDQPRGGAESDLGTIVSSVLSTMPGHVSHVITNLLANGSDPQERPPASLGLCLSPLGDTQYAALVLGSQEYSLQPLHDHNASVSLGLFFKFLYV